MPALALLNLSSVGVKLAIIAGLVVIILAAVNALPDAQPLPSQVTDGVDFLFSTVLWFDEFFPTPTFFTVLYLSIQVYFYYLSILVVIKIGQWVLKTAA